LLNRDRARQLHDAQVAAAMPEVQRRQAEYEAERNLIKQDAILRNARLHAESLQAFENSPGNNGYRVPDASGIGNRGYEHRGINQPFARDLAAAIKAQDVVGKTTEPKLDANAKRFLAGALPYIRPELYGPNPTSSGSCCMIVNKTIRQLERMA